MPFWLNSIWHYVVSSAALSTLIGGAAVAIAVLLPKQFDWITDLRKWAIVVAVCAFSYSLIYGWGYRHGLQVKQDQWDAALVTEFERGTKAGDDAANTVRGDTPKRVRDDQWNRDNWRK